MMSLMMTPHRYRNRKSDIMGHIALVLVCLAIASTMGVSV